MRLFTTLFVIAAITALAVPCAALDPTALVDKWEGFVDPEGGKPWPDGMARVLIITSVEQKGDTWVLSARYGIPGVGTKLVEAALAIQPDQLTIRFITVAKGCVELALKASDPNVLEGTIQGRNIVYREGRTELIRNRTGDNYKMLLRRIPLRQAMQ